MIRAVYPAFLFLMFGLGLERPPWRWGGSPTVQGPEDIASRLGERGPSLDTCHVQRRRFVRLKQLMVRSIDQVKRCLHPSSSITYRWDELWRQILSKDLSPRLKCDGLLGNNKKQHSEFSINITLARKHQISSKI